MEVFNILLILATFLCSLVAGFLFSFAIVTMPGIRSLNDREFIRAFQVIDRVVQNNQWLFVLVWVGSVVAIVASALFGFGQLDVAGFMLVFFATCTYLVGVQLPTITINIPLNNKLQTLDVETMSDIAQKKARKNFESRWNLWNSIRAGFSSLTSAFLIIALFRL